MSPTHPEAEPTPIDRIPPTERRDASRNRARILDAARRLVDEQGAGAVTMDAVAEAAGVGKGTVFRRFGSRTGLMLVLLDEDEAASQHAFLFGPAPLGPDAAPLDRLIALGAERLRFTHHHHELLSAANRDPATRHGPATAILHSHVKMLLAAAGTTGDLDAQAHALLALLDVDYVEHQLRTGRTQDSLERAWADLTHKICGH